MNTMIEMANEAKTEAPIVIRNELKTYFSIPSKNDPAAFSGKENP